MKFYPFTLAFISLLNANGGGQFIRRADNPPGACEWGGTLDVGIGATNRFAALLHLNFEKFSLLASSFRIFG